MDFSRLLALFVLQLAVFVAIGGTLALRRKIKNSRRPVQDRLLRAPGESLGKKAMEWRENSLTWVALLPVIPMAFALQGNKQPWQWIFFPAFFCSIAITIPIFVNIARYQRDELGFMGERAVGAELNVLMLDGCRVFHDYPADPKWNIDHIVVAPSGIFAVETKTRRKRRTARGKEDHRIVFDGSILHFPRFKSSEAVEQARRNAVSLGRELTRALAEPVVVKPILTFPGWFVERTGKSDVAVVNPKQIRPVIVTGGPRQLSSVQIDRIAAWIGEKCRDVEF